MRTRLVLLLAGALLLSLGSVQAEFAWLQLDDSSIEEGGDVGDPAADLVDLYFSPTETIAGFRMDLLEPADPANYTYVVYLDNTGTAGYFNYRLVYDSAGATLQEWSPPRWNIVQSVNLTQDPSWNSLIWEVPIDAIGGLADLRIAFRTYEGSPDRRNTLDRGPDGGVYLIQEETIPNLPLLGVPAFLGALGGAVILLRRRVLPGSRA